MTEERRKLVVDIISLRERVEADRLNLIDDEKRLDRAEEALRAYDAEHSEEERERIMRQVDLALRGAKVKIPKATRVLELIEFELEAEALNGKEAADDFE